MTFKVKLKVILAHCPISDSGVAHNRYKGRVLEQGRQTGILHLTSHNLWLRDFLSQRGSFSNISVMVLSNVFI